jgi:hypothetical protein
MGGIGGGALEYSMFVEGRFAFTLLPFELDYPACTIEIEHVCVTCVLICVSMHIFSTESTLLKVI